MVRGGPESRGSELGDGSVDGRVRGLGHGHGSPAGGGRVRADLYRLQRGLLTPGAVTILSRRPPSLPEIVRTGFAAEPHEALRRVDARHKGRFDVLVELAEAPVPD